jgi:uncharacterized protein (TIGR03437 family)
MNRKRWILIAKIAAVLSVPLMLWAFSSGAPQRSTGAPGDDTCLRGGCHIGTRTDNSESLELLWEGGQNYQPGVKQRFTVRIGAMGRRYGFSASARLESSAINGQAGRFDPVGPTTYVICDSGQDRPATGCPPSAPVEFITHSDAQTSNTFTFDWTPPANASAGAVVIYVAANSSDGPAPGGAKIHLKSLRLQPGAGGGGVRPAISSGGVVQAGAFGAGSRIAPGSWIEIFGRDLATTTREWGGADFNGNNAPTNLNNVQVRVDGRPAFVRFISPTQVNVQVPDGIASGPVQVTVQTPGGTSDPISVTGAARAPGLLSPSNFLVAGKQYVVAQFADGTFAGPPNLIAGVPFRLPRPGDRLVIYGVGFGATNPAIAAGTIVGAANSLQGLTVQVGSAPATVEYGGLAPSFVGLYQFNIVVPNVQAGDQQIFMEVGGVRTQTGLILTTGN